MKEYCVDSSALLAYAFSEEGADKAYRYLHNSVISSVIYSEFFSVVLERKANLEDAFKIINFFNIHVIDFNEEQALITAELREKTKSKGLSLGDRSCLALAIIKKIPVVTADKIWSKLDIGVDIKLIR